MEGEGRPIGVSVIVPTYNEYENIISVIRSIEENLPRNIATEIVVVDDNSPDGTGRIVEDYINGRNNNKDCRVKIIKRNTKKGLASAIMDGIRNSRANSIVVTDSDFSHPPKIIPQMIKELKKQQYDIVVASRYVKGGTIHQWPYKRKLISKIATKISKSSLGIGISDPLSGFFAFERHIIHGLNFDAIGYKMLLEILVKVKGARVKEIPYEFTDRRLGSSKLEFKTIVDYLKAVWRLYRYGRTAEKKEKRASVHFLYKAGRFYTVGASGFAVNYLTTLFFSSGIVNLWYLHANVIGIIFSITTNFLLNKWWTFEDRDFGFKGSIIQYGKFVGFSLVGAGIQLGMVYALVESYQMFYPLALILAVLTASFSNFSLNKVWTFNEKFWS